MTRKQTAANLLAKAFNSKRRFGHGRTRDAAEVSKLLDTYRQSSSLVGELPGGDAFDTYLKGRLKSMKGFSEIQAPDETSVDKKLNDSATGKALISDINKLLEPTKATTDAQTAFNDTMSAINAYIRDETSIYHPTALIDYAHTVVNEAIEAIEKQQKHEAKALQDKFKEEGFKTKFKEAMGLTSDDEYTKITGEMLATLQKKQTEELAKFKKEVSEPLVKLHADQNKKEEARLSVLHVQQIHGKGRWKRFWDEDSHEKIKELNTKAMGKKSFDMSVDGKDNTMSFIGVDIKDMPYLYSAETGLKIKNQNGVLTMEMPAHISSFFYYGSADNKPKLDIMTLAQAIRAQGFETITMTISNMDKERTKECAMAAYEACIEAGFKPEDIVIKGGDGKAMTVDEIFEGQSHRVAISKSKYQSFEQELAEQEKRAKDSPHRAADFKHVKDGVQKVRDEQLAKKHSSAVTPTDPTSSSAPP